MIEIKLKKFPLHLPYTKNKKAPDKYIKLNYQSIYNGKINRFSRATLMGNLKSFIMNKIPKKVKVTEYPVKIHYEIHTVINHGSISRRNNKLNWKYPSDKYEPTWDIENLSNIFIKSGNDALVTTKVIIDDSVQYVDGVSYEFIPVDDINDRKIIIKII